MKINPNFKNNRKDNNIYIGIILNKKLIYLG